MVIAPHKPVSMLVGGENGLSYELAVPYCKIRCGELPEPAIWRIAHAFIQHFERMLEAPISCHAKYRKDLFSVGCIYPCDMLFAITLYKLPVPDLSEHVQTMIISPYKGDDQEARIQMIHEAARIIFART